MNRPGSSTPEPAQPATVNLRLLATTDLHAHLLPWDYLADTPAPVGLAQLAPLIAKARAEATNSLLLDNGDFLQGSPLGDWQHRHGTAVHPMIAAMNTLGYDAATLGNHEFSHGLPFLTTALRDARFPLVASNLSRSDGETLLPEHLVLDRAVTDTAGRTHTIRIAIIGFAPPQTTRWEALCLNGSILAEDILQAADRVLQSLHGVKPDLVVALAHTGIAEATPPAGMENAALPLAAHPRIDIMVTGHTHLVFPLSHPVSADSPDKAASVDAKSGTLHGKPAVMAGFFGSHLGQIDLTLQQGPTGWCVTSHRSAALPAPDQPACTPALAALAAPAHNATRRWMNQLVGYTSGPLHSHFALVSPVAALHLIAQAQIGFWRTRLPPDLADLPLLASVAPFRTGGRGGPRNVTDIPAGPILNRHVADLYTHANTPVLLCLTKTGIEDWLERAAIVFHTVPHGAQDAPLIRDDVPGFDFDLIDGLSFRIDLSQPPRFDAKATVINPQARRITALTLGGRPLPADQRFLVATNSYRVGSATYPIDGLAPVARSAVPIRDLVATHIAGSGSLALHRPATWRFAPMPGTTVLLDTGPEADRYRADIADMNPEPLGLTDKGFLRFRLSL